MPLDYFHPHTLNRVIDERQPVSSFLLDTFFPGIEEQKTKLIHFDRVKNRAAIAAFVHPNATSPITKKPGQQVESLSPAYVKDTRVFEYDDTVRRLPGESFSGNLTEAERLQIQIVDALVEQDQMITNREILMASELLRTGGLVIEGPKYKREVVTFGRASALTATLAGAARWGEAGVSPVKDIEAWAELVHMNNGGRATVFVLDPKAAQLFKADPEAKYLLDTRRGSASTAELGPIARGPGEDSYYRLAVMGNIEVWVYQEYLPDQFGVTHQVLPDYTVIGGSLSTYGGLRMYGAIQDLKAVQMLGSGGSQRRRFSRSWETDGDPSFRYLLMQSAPLLIPQRVNGSFSATVR